MNPLRSPARLWAVLASCAALAGCQRSAAPVDPERRAAVSPDLAPLLAPENLAEALAKRGGAHVTGSISFHVAPQAAAAEGLRGAQDILTKVEVDLDAQGHYALQEQNDQDGGREIVFTGEHIAVKLRYGKLMKRDARAPEPQRLLAQALGGPGAFWDLFGAAVRTELVGPAGPDGAQRVALKLGAVPERKEPPAPHPGTHPVLSSWRRTAVPTALEGELSFLPATAEQAPVLIAARLSGTFRGRAAGTPVEGKMEVDLQVSNLGQVTPPTMPEAAEDLRLGQRTILEERALLEGLPSIKPSPAGQ